MELMKGIPADSMDVAEARIEMLRFGLSAAMQTLREKEGKTQEEVANILGVKQAAVAKLESAFRSHSFDSVIRYLAAFEAELLVAVKMGDTIYQASDDMVATIEAGPGVKVPWEVNEVKSASYATTPATVSYATTPATNVATQQPYSVSSEQHLVSQVQAA